MFFKHLYIYIVRTPLGLPINLNSLVKNIFVMDFPNEVFTQSIRWKQNWWPHGSWSPIFPSLFEVALILIIKCDRCLKNGGCLNFRTPTLDDFGATRVTQILGPQMIWDFRASGCYWLSLRQRQNLHGLIWRSLGWSNEQTIKFQHLLDV